MVTIRDSHLEEQIDTERERRGDATQAKTLGDLARERLMQLEIEHRSGAAPQSRTREAEPEPA